MKPATNQVVNIPNNEVMNYSFKGQIPVYSMIPQKARDADVLKYIHGKSLIYLGQLYDDRCTSNFDKN